MPNPVVHFEVMGRDPIALQKFYADLFGWNVHNMPELNNYATVSTEDNERGIGGGIGTSADMQQGVTFYVETEDLQAMLDKAEQLGGKVVNPVSVMPGIVTLAHFADPEGNVIGLVAPEPPPAE